MFVPYDEFNNNTNYYTNVGQLIICTINIPNDTDFYQEEVYSVIKSINKKKSPGKNSMANKNILEIFNFSYVCNSFI